MNDDFFIQWQQRFGAGYMQSMVIYSLIMTKNRSVFLNI